MNSEPSKKSVLIFLPNDILGGAEKALKTITVELVSRKYEVYVQFVKESVSGGWEDLQDKVHLNFTNFKKERHAIFWLPQLIWKHKKRGLNLTFASNTGLNGILGICRKFGILKTKALIVRESTQLLDRFGGLRGKVFRWLYLLGYPSTDLVICQTTYMRDRLIFNLPKAKDWNVQVIPNPIDIHKVCYESKQHFISEKYGKYILGVGRLIKLKGFDLLIKALYHLPEDINLVLVGDGDEEKNLKELVCKLGLIDRVFFEGYQKNPFTYMKHALVCIVSSRLEGFPNTLLQMMTLNERVVSTLCAGDIDKLKGVITCNIDDLSGLVSAIKTAIGLNEEDIINNRILFNSELELRSPEKYVDQILSKLAIEKP